eukprot:g12179.t1
MAIFSWMSTPRGPGGEGLTPGEEGAGPDGEGRGQGRRPRTGDRKIPAKVRSLERTLRTNGERAQRPGAGLGGSQWAEDGGDT